MFISALHQCVNILFTSLIRTARCFNSMLAKVSNDCMSTKDLLVTAPREGPCMLALSVCMKPEHIAFFLCL